MAVFVYGVGPLANTRYLNSASPREVGDMDELSPASVGDDAEDAVVVTIHAESLTETTE